MAAFIDDLKTARDFLAATYALEAERRFNRSDDGKPIHVSYSMGGKSVSWTGSLSEMRSEIQEMTDFINRQEIPEYRIRVWQ